MFHTGHIGSPLLSEQGGVCRLQLMAVSFRCVSGTDSETLSVCSKLVCVSDQGHSMVTHGQISFQTATPMPHASGRSPRGGDRHGPNHTYSGALCVELSELTSSIQSGMGRAASKGPETAVNEVTMYRYHTNSVAALRAPGVAQDGDRVFRDVRRLT